MANTEIAVASSEDYTIQIDSDGPDGAYFNNFFVDHTITVGSAWAVLFSVAEDGFVNLHGRWTSFDFLRFNNTSSGDVFVASLSGTSKAKVTADGLGDFSTGGIRLPVVTAGPGGTLGGTPGQIIFWDDTAGSGKWKVCLCLSGTAWYIKAED